MEKTRESFVRVAESRTRRTIKQIRLVANLANRNAYSFSEEDVKAIFDALEGELRVAKGRFRGPSVGKEIDFTLA